MHNRSVLYRTPGEMSTMEVNSEKPKNLDHPRPSRSIHCRVEHRLLVSRPRLKHRVRALRVSLLQILGL